VTAVVPLLEEPDDFDSIHPSELEENPFALTGVKEAPPSANGGTAEPFPLLDATRRSAVDGATWLQQEPDELPAMWGDEDAPLWVEGEGLMIVGPDGVGKTLLQQRLMRGRLGLDAALLGVPIAASERPVLYIAADRPRQAVRAFRRTLENGDEDVLRDRLRVWRGPLPFDITDDPPLLARFVAAHNAGTVFIDSLKDIAYDLVKDEVGSRVNAAFQEVVAAGIELCVSHHQRKELQGAGRPRKLADVYGSRWLTAGIGSVVLLWGNAGDLIVDLAHLKQPAEPFGPYKLVHDHTHGATAISGAIDVEQHMAARGLAGITAADIARLQTGSDDPDRNAVERARRHLEKLVAQDRARRVEGAAGDPIRYVALEEAA
jgi:replicative DNA helicase